MTDQDKKPVLDEQSFEKLLEAAYVLQEHNRKMRELEESLESQREQLVQQEMAREALQPKSPSESSERSPADSDYTLTLSEIVEAQRQIQMHNLGLDEAMAVVAERVARITHSSGAAIGILEGNIVRYRAGTGAPALPIGSERPLDRAICVASVRTGKVIRSEDMNTEFLFDPELCRGRGIRSLLAVPIYHDGDIVGALELYFDRVQGFAEQDIHTCQLMAGLVTEAIGRDAEMNLKNSMAAERSTMLAAIEKLKPTLAIVAEGGHAGASSASISTASKEQFPCWKCGSSLLAAEQFCGNCGAARSRGDEPSDMQSMQSKIASAWNTRRASLEASAAAPPNGKMAATAGTGGTGDLPQSTVHPPGTEHAQREDVDLEEAWDTELEKFSASEPTIKENFLSQVSVAESTDEDLLVVSSSDELSSNTPDEITALLAPQQEEIVWSSAAKARQFLESVSGKRKTGALARYWHSRRGDFYLGFAIILVILVIRWGIWSEPSVGAAGQGNTTGIRRKHFDPNANLSAFDKLLISMGLAEAPDPPPEYRGNPDTQVWVDLHTALYYCPGADLYGKTPNGKTTNQRDAQLDQFEPAYRKACD